MQSPAIENPPPEELPVSLSVPEPPLEMEAFGSGTGELEDLLQPSAVEEESSLVEVEVAAVAEEPEEIPAELGISTITTETTEKEDLPALMPAPEAVDETSDFASEPGPSSMREGKEEDLNLPDVSPVDAEVNPEQPVDNVVLAYPEPSEFGEESNTEEATEMERQETAPEVLVVEEEETPGISTEELTEDEFLLVDKDVPEPAITDSAPQATTLSPERDSPFTHMDDISPFIEEHPDIGVPAIVEV